MERMYANLGLTTAISRLGLEGAASGDAAYLQRQLRQIEAALPAFNLDPAMAHLAAEIAAFEEDLRIDQRVALIMLIVASMVALNEGSTRLPVTGPQAREPMARILGPLCTEADADGETERAAMMARAIAKLLESGDAASVIARTSGEYRPLLYLPPYIYHQHIRTAEIRLAERLQPRLGVAGAAASEREIAAAIADVCRRPHWIGGREISLSGEQRSAVRNAAERRLAIISGGPGTGKTSIVLAFLRVLVRLGIKPAEIALAAPTGKAAYRMSESIRDGLAQVREPAAADEQLLHEHPEALTVHRLLGYSPSRGSFLHHGNNPLPASVVVVDESSMLDLNLTNRLAAALRPQARMVMLGDADQLPSVAAGAVFRELVAAVQGAQGKLDAEVCTRLTQSYRMDPGDAAGRTIFALAQKINEGAVSVSDGTPLIEQRIEPAGLRFDGVELLNPEGAAIEQFLDHWYAEKIRDSRIDALASKAFAYGENGFDDTAVAELKRIFEHLAASRILCVTRVLATGAERINAAMHRRAAVTANRLPERARFVAGEPVMVVRNDYERMLFNGDQGIIARVKRPEGGESHMAVFMRGESCAAFHLAALGEALEHCYATTIHKAQGSEFDCVAIVMPERDIPILSRELLYTAVSRARKSVVLVGSIEMVRAAAARKGMRYSGLAELLNPAAEKAQP